MNCNLPEMNSWHSFSPNGRWMVFTSKSDTPYTQLYLTHLDEEGNDTPAVLIPDCTASNRAVNLPEFVNAPADSLRQIEIPAVGHSAAEGFGQQGTALMFVGQHDVAVSYLERALELDPGLVWVRANLAFALHESGRGSEAVEHYQRVLEDDPTEPRARGALALLFAEMGAPEVDLAACVSALRVDPGNVSAHRDLGLAMARRHEHEEALEHLGFVLRANPSDLDAHRALASLHLWRADVRAAVQHLEALVSLAPQDFEAHTILGWQLAAGAEKTLRNPRRALLLAQQAGAIVGPEHPLVLDLAAAALAADGRYEQAMVAAERAAHLCRDRAPTLAAAIELRLACYRDGTPLRD